MAIRNFQDAQHAAARWLRTHIDTDVISHIHVNPDGWRVSDSGFYNAVENSEELATWLVRYWHTDDPNLTGALRIYEDGRIEPNAVIGHGCLGIVETSMFRIDPSSKSPVFSGYAEAGSIFYGPHGGHEPRVPDWEREGWPIEYWS